MPHVFELNELATVNWAKAIHLEKVTSLDFFFRQVDYVWEKEADFCQAGIGLSPWPPLT